nr:hypothetical protein CFP56_64767 [Quercus suber]
MEVHDGDGEAIHRNLRVTAVDDRGLSTAWFGGLVVVDEAGGGGPLEHKVGGGEARGGEEEQRTGEQHDEWCCDQVLIVHSTYLLYPSLIQDLFSFDLLIGSPAIELG